MEDELLHEITDEIEILDPVLFDDSVSYKQACHRYDEMTARIFKLFGVKKEDWLTAL